VAYRREYFTSYPDDVLVVRLTADDPGALSFTVRPEIPYLDARNPLDSKSGTVEAEGDTVTLAGTIDYYQVNYEIQVKVLPEGGTLKPGDSTIRVKDADAVTLLVAVDTNYELGPHIFLNEPKEKLDPDLDPHEWVTATMSAATRRGYASLKARHPADYRELFGRVSVDLNSGVSPLPTHRLLENYKKGKRDPYLEELIFQYGRYLLIASSRETTLPAHLQGAWSQYEVSPWCAGYWHNINVQMNYGGAMSANLAETFQAYLNYFEAYKPKAHQFAREYIKEGRPGELSDAPSENGWILGTGANAYQISGRSTHSCPGTGGFTTQLLMEYYNYTQDEAFLRETAYPAMLEMSKFFDKTLHETEDGLLLIQPSASPEIKVDGEYYVTQGCTYDQGWVWENHNNVLRAAEAIGAEDPFLETIRSQIPRLDPILVGSSGQIKEFREEDAYGEIGDPHHRHTSHLCPLYPGTLIGDANPEWKDAASTTLDLRGKPENGWATAHRMNLRARLGEAEEALGLYRLFITEKAAPNLWSMHPPFQIDGNFGVMAGVVEMLLQSHDGAIEPIPALPEAWEDGSFDGLVARGNFEVSAAWRDRKLTRLAIRSRSGKDCRIEYPGLANASVVGASGTPVSVRAEGPGRIAFPTRQGMRYTLSFAPDALRAPHETASALEGTRPNIILVITDDQGYGDLGAHGHPFLETPHLDRLRAQSTRFTDFQVSPTCAPTRGALMAGKYPFKLGITHTILERDRMALSATTLAESLSEAGYATGIFGKWHLGDEDPYQPHNRGFDEVFIHGAGGIGQSYPGSQGDIPDNGYFDPVIKHNGTFVQTEGYCTDIFFRQTLGWIDERRKNADRPFFAYLATNAPHSPMIVAERYQAPFKDRVDGDKPAFYGMIVNIDDNMGLLMNKLDEWDLAEDTLLIFMTDNGTARGRHVYNAGLKGGKGSVHEGGTRVPFFLRLSGRLEAGRDIDVLARHFDLFPTLAGIAEAAVPDDLDGRSLLPLLDNPVTDWPDRITFFHQGRWAKEGAPGNWGEGNPDPDASKYRGFAVRDERWRLVGTDQLYDPLHNLDDFTFGTLHMVPQSRKDAFQAVLPAAQRRPA